MKTSKCFRPYFEHKTVCRFLNDKYFNGKLYTDVKQTARAMNDLLPYCLRGNYTDATERIRLLRYACFS